VRQEQRHQYAELGRQILQKTFRQEGHEFTEKALDGVLKKFKRDSVTDLYTTVGQGHHTAREVMLAVFPGERQKRRLQSVFPSLRPRGRASKPAAKDGAVPLKGLIPGMAVHFAHCCHPLPGERIVGIVTTGKGVTVHTIDCETLENFQNTPERWIDIAWDAALSTIIGKNLGNISNLKITSRSTDFFEMLIDVEVSDVKHLTNIIAALRATSVIASVERARG
jgi:GTP pyrophosphokinase